jgi:NAD(P)-dependent dehydrogenase (short-subunit alcohol dehydrogenase family)
LSAALQGILRNDNGKNIITGSADGLGELAAKSLITQGHQVVLHARNNKRGQEALDKVPGAETVITADLSSVDETQQLASKVNTLGKFDAVIHNAASTKRRQKRYSPSIHSLPISLRAS